MTTYYRTIDSPIGPLLLTATSRGLSGLYMHARPVGSDWVLDEGRLDAAADQLSRYFEGELREFDLPLDLQGTPFQLDVWNALCTIPYGETRSYGDLARAIGRPAAVRAVGLANGRNPVSIIVPCHRVIGSDGSLTGYGGGLERKKYLLELESAEVLQARLPGAG